MDEQPRRGPADLIRAFFRMEAASGILLLAAALIAIGWANSPVAHSYRALFGLPLPGGLTLATFIGDVLMTVFFFVVGMEIKRELVTGELKTPAQAVLPAVAALGGMVVPAALFALLTAGTPAVRGWGIPMATDIAFSIGALTLLRSRVPHGLMVFVTALAIFDDVGGILVIAFFYGHGLHAAPLGVAAALSAALFLAARLGLRWGSVFALGGAGLWLALHHGGVHPTIAGVITGLAIPTGAVLERLLHRWHPWVAFGIMPLFALASSGVPFAGGEHSPFGRVTVAVAAALFVGKQAGIFGATFLAVRTGLAERPGGSSWPKVFGVSVVAGIGFTVALFMANLAYPDHPALLDQARAGILLGSLASALAGIAILRATRRGNI